RELPHSRDLTLLVATHGEHAPQHRHPTRAVLTERILLEAERVPLRRRVELRGHLRAQHRAHSLIRDRHDRPRDPRPAKRTVKVRAVHQRLHQHTTHRVPPPHGRPTPTKRAHDVPHPVRQVHHHRSRHTSLRHRSHRQSRPPRTRRTVPNARPVHARTSLNQHLRLPSLGVPVRHRHERHSMNQRRRDRLRQLHLHLVLTERRR